MNYRIVTKFDLTGFYMNIYEQIKYWVTVSENDIPVMEHLFESGDYSYSLFIGHLILEKILKAHFVKIREESPPRTHDLFKLANQLSLEFSEEQLKFLISVNTFNIEARYPEEKLSFYKKCTKEFALDNIYKIKELYLWLRSQI
ncbi:MAG: HEPN domain-containing protein [Candidatus Kapabacteria bacterium]|nr:HEPN domain-containing protein [Candidatus Kapabacteria bacterium]